MINKERVCPICSNHAPIRLTKKNTNYFQCSSCKTLFSDALDNDNMVGGGNEEQRNKEQNKERITRINEIINGRKEDSRILDFGAGHGLLVKDIIESGIPCDAFDAYNPEFNKIPEKDTYHIVTMIEVIEHLSSPYMEIDVVRRSLKKGGLVMIETSFIDIAYEEHISLEDFFYVEPSVGHSTIFSHHGLDLLMCLKGFAPRQHWNRNVRCYQKV